MDHRSLALAALCLLTGAPLRAQFTARADLSVSNRYVWHGISRAAGRIVQPSLALGRRFGAIGLEAGAVLHFEFDPVAAGELSETGAGNRSLGESDLWARVSLEAGPLRLHGGVVRYEFNGNAQAGGLSPDQSTTEIYAAVTAFGTYSSPTVELWHDVDRVRGTYVAISGRTPVLGWPLQPFHFIYLDAEAGLNIGQDSDPARPGDLANFAGRGITHAGAGLSVSSRVCRWPGVGLCALTGGLRTQFNFDDATRFDGAGRRRDLQLWLWAGLSLVLGGAARSVR